MAEQAVLQRRAEPSPPDAARVGSGYSVGGARQAQLAQLHARLNGRARGGPVAGAGIIQAVLDPALGAGNQAFREGLVKGHYDPVTNNADMHVDPKNDAHPHLAKADVIAAFEDLYQAMHANFQATGNMGTIDWNPQGAAVIKMVAELLGESLGGKLGRLSARIKKFARQKFGTPPVGRPGDALSADIVPEHLAYLGALKGKAGVSIKGVGVPLTAATNDLKLAEFNQNMVDNSPAGNARLANYGRAALAGIPVSLSITLHYTQLPALIATLRSA